MVGSSPSGPARWYYIHSTCGTSLSQELNRSTRLTEPLGAILFDIDHFKTINDTHGHQSGDQVLKMIAKAVKGVLRDSDTLARYGGDEFLAVLPAADETDVQHLAERIRHVVEGCVVVAGSARVRTSVSVGAVSHSGIEAADVHDIIRRADVAMYAAKRSGRNAITLAGSRLDSSADST